MVGGKGVEAFPKQKGPPTTTPVERLPKRGGTSSRLVELPDP